MIKHPSLCRKWQIENAINSVIEGHLFHLLFAINFTLLVSIMLFVKHSRTAGGGKAMKLGSKAKDVDTFVDRLRSEGTGENDCIKP